MTWQLTLSGSLTDPNEEKAILQRCEDFVRQLAEDPRHVVNHARFQGTYGSFEKTAQDLGAAPPADRPEETPDIEIIG